MICNCNLINDNQFKVVNCKKKFAKKKKKKKKSSIRNEKFRSMNTNAFRCNETLTLIVTLIKHSNTTN